MHKLLGRFLCPLACFVHPIVCSALFLVARIVLAFCLKECNGVLRPHSQLVLKDIEAMLYDFRVVIIASSRARRMHGGGGLHLGCYIPPNPP